MDIEVTGEVVFQCFIGSLYNWPEGGRTVEVEEPSELELLVSKSERILRKTLAVLPKVVVDPTTGLVDVEVDNRTGARCPGGKLFCTRYAGQATDHVGYGPCWTHDKGEWRKIGVWMMAHAIAQELQISPWEALLLCVRRAATWARFYEMKLAQVENDDDLRPGGSAYDWVQASERVNVQMARFAKMAVDAGVAAMMIQQARAEGEQIAQVVNTALGEAGLSHEQEVKIRAALRRALLELESSPSAIGS